MFVLFLLKVFLKFIFKLFKFALAVSYAEEVKQKIDDMLKINCIAKQEYSYLVENLEIPRIPIFYGLPKMYKIFDSFPPLQPTVSGFNFCT